MANLHPYLAPSSQKAEAEEIQREAKKATGGSEQLLRKVSRTSSALRSLEKRSGDVIAHTEIIGAADASGRISVSSSTSIWQPSKAGGTSRPWVLGPEAEAGSGQALGEREIHGGGTDRAEEAPERRAGESEGEAWCLLPCSW